MQIRLIVCQRYGMILEHSSYSYCQMIVTFGEYLLSKKNVLIVISVHIMFQNITSLNRNKH